VSGTLPGTAKFQQKFTEAAKTVLAKCNAQHFALQMAPTPEESSGQWLLYTSTCNTVSDDQVYNMHAMHMTPCVHHGHKFTNHDQNALAQ
jgi:hypothetical protein